MTALKTAPLPFVDISFRNDLGILFTRWAAAVAPPQFAEGYTRALDSAQESDARFWLVDLRQRNTPDPESQEWFNKGFIPAVKAAFTAQIYMAYLVTPLQQSRIPQPEHRSALVPLENCILVRCFTREQDAINWLNECPSQSGCDV